MPKIENWSRISSYLWENDKTDEMISLGEGVSKKTQKPYWEADVVGESKRFDTKKKARKYIIQWMKDNPLPTTKTSSKPITENLL